MPDSGSKGGQATVVGWGIVAVWETGEAWEIVVA